jgi:penicillin-binding protein 1C
VDLASGYGFLARKGAVTRASAVLDVSFPGGAVWRPGTAGDTAVFSEEVAWLVMDMLADPEARRPMFGDELPVDDLPFRIAFKTGTSRGFADTVAVGVTEQITVAAWAGNFDGKPTWGVVAMDAAAPLVRAGMMSAARGRALTLPRRPVGVVEASVCALSGELASEDCPHRKREFFRDGTVPTDTCDWHAREGDRVSVRYPSELASWAERTRHAGGREI